MEQEWLPLALSLGITYQDFWHMNPKIIGIYIKAQAMKQEQEMQMLSISSWLNGIYVAEALKATVGNMFSGKGSKQYKYPDAPINVTESKDKQKNDAQKQQELFVAKMEILKANFELNKLNK